MLDVSGRKERDQFQSVARRQLDPVEGRDEHQHQ